MFAGKTLILSRFFLVLLGTGPFFSAKKKSQGSLPRWRRRCRRQGEGPAWLAHHLPK